MPCPFFEPTGVAPDPLAAHARLPLIAEHEGLCHAGEAPIPVPHERRFGGCNHGREQERCPRLPSDAEAAVRRFTVQAQTESCLSVLVSEEIAHMPVRWQVVQYSATMRKLLTPPAGICESAQIEAFCASYLQRVTVVAKLNPYER